ncbi:MAG: redoxin domain-containing protein, partial [Candidatus Hydrogenedentes bacterium]|nr:redoxin domain-containing protein [Candidatus Hydrogenedentota bacterium]
VLKVAGSEGTLTVLPPPGLMTAALPNVPVKLGEEQDVKIEAIALKRLPEVSGTVLDDEGQPVAGALVSSHDFETPLLALTNEAGAFQLTLGTMPDKKKVLLRVEHPLRFLDKKLEVDLDRTKPLKVTLAPFQPDLAERPLLPADKELADLRQAPAPPLEGADWFNGAPLTLEALRGKVVVLHFWAGFDDSAPGAGRLQEVQALHAALRTVDDAVFIGVHDASSTAAEVTTFVQRFNVQFPVMRDADPYKTFTSYGIVYLPQTVLIDKKGELRYFQVEGRLLELIKALRREG